MTGKSRDEWQVSRMFEPGRQAVAAPTADSDRHVTIKDLPDETRPRERLLAHGAATLSDVELLAIILGGGTRADTALEIAGKLLRTYGGWRELARCSPVELMEQASGIGQARAASICAALAIAHRYAGQKPKVGIVGEIYVRNNDFINQDVTRAIESYGGEALKTSIAELGTTSTRATSQMTTPLSRSF